jgi:hypothetical protein
MDTTANGMSETEFRTKLENLDERLAELLAIVDKIAEELKELKACGLALTLEAPDHDEAFMDELEEAFAECARPDNAAKEEEHGT